MAALQVEAGWTDERLLMAAFEVNETLSLALSSYLQLTSAAEQAAPAPAAQRSEEEMIAAAIEASLRVRVGVRGR